ncbi:probable tRNA (uracil-O(2)-)-methyltransferase isoform X2 [Pseudonaja textilis]|uniref:probable tRNA (uracil-O(2)-)-methyltransferase isoform X2 n=1 Tax=Pseudonaja textilis TaxID=8673 RepID=UPI000EAABA18|nr:probable tRNA (uracil-O(2)-)-methyltransferase isoform X2 [Pseudonaja textilis]
MEAVGEGALRDPAGRLPDGFWAAAAVWLERPQVANKRLSGACAEPPLRVPRAGGGAAGAAERAWGAFCAGAEGQALGLRGPVELVLRRLLPRRPPPPPPPAPELVARDVLNGRMTFLPLEETCQGQYKVWPEVTDPEKFVYEDVAIATYLLVLWEDERARRGLSEKQSFLDLGCGNGLLVHILGNEGHPGKGIDVRRRKIWDMYGPQTCLEERAINPDHLYPEADWLIGNHSDELTPWIPVIAARSSSSCRYFLLPCCFFDFYGKYNRRQSQKSQYREYLDFVAEVGTVCGFQVEEDCLRIPSTKRVCLIGVSRTGADGPALEDERREFIRKRRPGGPVTLAPGGSRPRPRQEQSLSAAGQRRCAEEREGRPSRPPGFLPRGKEQVRNCTTLPHALVDQVALKVAHLLLSETDGSLLHGPSSPWNRGGSLPLSDIAGHLDKATLKTLKKEHGGLQTLLRNNHQVFQVQHGKVRLRDWREGERPRKQLRARPARARLPSEATKTRLCWFDRHHPQGCPLPSASCPYAHGSAELNQRRIVPGDKELLVQLC